MVSAPGSSLPDSPLHASPAVAGYIVPSPRTVRGFTASGCTGSTGSPDGSIPIAEAGLPVVLLSPLIALQYDLAPALYGTLALSLALGTPVLSMVGAIGAALTLGLRGGGMLLSLLVLPLYIPVLIMGAGSVELASSGLSPAGQLLLLAAALVGAAAFAPWAIAAALRISME